MILICMVILVILLLIDYVLGKLLHILHYLSSIENRTLRCSFYPPHDKIERTVSQRHFKKIKERLEII